MDDVGPQEPVEQRANTDGLVDPVPTAVEARRAKRRWPFFVAPVVLIIIVVGGYLLAHRTDPAAQDAKFIQQATAALGKAPLNPAKLVATARSQCDGSAAELSYLASLIRANNSARVAALTRIGIAVYCPDRSTELEQDLAR